MESNNVTLNDLRTKPTPYRAVSELKEVNISDIAPYKEEVVGKEQIDEILGELDFGLERIKKQSHDFVQQVKEEELDDEINSDIEDDLEDERDLSFTREEVQESQPKKLIIKREEPKEEVKSNTVKESMKISDDLEDDLDDDLKEDKTEKEVNREALMKQREEALTKLKTSLNETIKPVVNSINLSSFTISKKPISINNALKKAAPLNVATWGLFGSQIPVHIEEFKGVEIEKLDVKSYGNTDDPAFNRYKAFTSIYRLIYDHIQDESKPPFEAWLKKLNFFDINHIFFTIYKSCFENANYIPYTCDDTDCRETFVSKDIPVSAMIKYAEESDKIFARDIISKEISDYSYEYDVELAQVSDDYVIGFRDPSVFGIIFENAILKPEFTEKYSEFLANMAFIDSIYVIDRDSNELREIELESYPNNLERTVKTKIVKYSKILKTLNSDQLYTIDSIIKKISEKHDGISYMLPETECVKCGKKIKETPMSAENLLFTRHQLKGIANS